MPTFNINVPPENETIYPSPEGQAAVSCTVTNTAGFPARGKATIIAREGTPAGWISLEGTDERDFLPGEAQSFSVLVAVPPEAPPKSYGFHLNVANVADPNRDYVEGKIVSIDWKGKPIAPPTPHRWLIPAIIAAVVAVGVIVAIIVAKNKAPAVVTTQPVVPVTQPIVTPKIMKFLKGRTHQEAEAQLNSQQIPFIEVPEFSSQYAPGLVSRQSIDENKPVPADQKVTIWVSGTPVPRVATKTLGEAWTIIKDKNFNPESSGDYHKPATGTNPPEGKPAIPGSTVTILFPGGYRIYNEVDHRAMLNAIEAARRGTGGPH